MGAEENYLDKLLKSITEPKTAGETEAEETMSMADETEEELISSVTEEPLADEPITVEIKITDVIETPDASEETGELEVESVEQTSGETEIDGIDMSETPDIEPTEENLESELNLDEIDNMEIPDMELSDDFSIDDLESPAEEVKLDEAETSDELSIDEIDMAMSDELNLDEIEPVASDELNIDEIDMTISDELSIDEIDTAILEERNTDEIDADLAEAGEIELAEEATELISDVLNTEEIEMEVPAEESPKETEPEIPDELGIDEELEIPDELGVDEEPEITEDLRLGELDLEALDHDMSAEAIESEKPGVDGELEDVLSMLDDDADLAEINDILKKSDNNEPIQDEMMDLLNQMADDEAELVNAGVKDIVEDDGVPLPEVPIAKKKDVEPEEAQDKKGKVKKKKKEKDEEKAPGALGKFFNMLTEDLPGPTEEEYAAEDEAKAAKKKEEKEKKEQDKLAKDEEKKAKEEEKAAAKKAKADAAAQKKKEKDAAKAEKAAAKKAKQQAEAIKRAKRIPPKKIVAVAAFGASVFGAVFVSTTILSNQGYINVARKAFYDGDYKNVYLATYGMELNDSDVGLIQARSEVIMKMQRWYDSYQNNLKLNRQREALDALLHGIAAYDYINAEAEQYEVMGEVDGIKNTILDVLETKYGVSEAQARELLNYEDALAYTMALNDIITGK